MQNRQDNVDVDALNLPLSQVRALNQSVIGSSDMTVMCGVAA